MSIISIETGAFEAPLRGIDSILIASLNPSTRGAPRISQGAVVMEQYMERFGQLGETLNQMSMLVLKDLQALLEVRDSMVVMDSTLAGQMDRR